MADSPHLLLVDDDSMYLAFARGEGAEQSAPTDLLIRLEDIVSSARRADANITLAMPESLFVTLRPEAMRRALNNLLDNARRHAKTITLSAASISERFIQITIEDDGRGIPAAQRNQLFRPFETNVPGGTGLGLAIARDIINAHGGNIRLTDNPAGGLRAVVELPV